MWPSPTRLFAPDLVRIEPHGLDDSGTSHYSIIVDDSKTVQGMEYVIKSVEPTALVYSSNSADFQIQISHAASLEWNDLITVTISASSPCLVGHELGHSPYILNITSYVQLFHQYTDTLAPSNKTVWTTDGWRSQSHLTVYPWSSSIYIIDREYVDGPCPGAWIKSELHILNTSQYTFWNQTTQTAGGPTSFIGSKDSLPRCHRPELGNVCVVQARTRLTWLPNCHHNVSIWQSVSQMARLTPNMHETTYPTDFDTNRRLPIPDSHDLRYDMCTSVMCNSEEDCTSLNRENNELSSDGDIFIRQQQNSNTNWIEIVCEFEVVGFLDNIWSPHIYMRKWYGYEWY